MANNVRIMLGAITATGEDEVPYAAISGVRMVGAALGVSIDYPAAHAIVEAAQTIETGGEPPVIGEATTKGQLERAARVAATYGLTLITDSGDLTPEELLETLGGEDAADVPIQPEAEPPPEFDPEQAPSYRAGLLALSMMAASDGNPVGALQLANTIRNSYALTAEPDDQSPEDWADVLRTLFDAFPIQSEHGDIHSLARDVGR